MAERQRTKQQRDIVSAIQALHRADAPLNITAVKRSHPRLLKRVYRIKPFWGWRQALEAAGIECEEIRVHLQETVKCRLCKVQRLTLVQHLTRHHGVTCEEYRDEYPGAELTSDTYRSRLLGRGRNGGRSQRILPHWEPLWSPEYVLDRAYQVHTKGVSLHHVSVLTREPSLPRQACKYFGEWDEVLRRIGLDPLSVRLSLPKDRWTKRLVTDELRRLHQAGSGMMRIDIEDGHRPLCHAAVRLFGSYDDALKAAGIDPGGIGRPEPRNKKYGEKERQGLLRAVRKVAALEPVARDKAVRHLREKYARMVDALYGGDCWGKVAADAGVDLSLIQPLKGRYPTPEHVTREIRRRHREGRGINYQAISKTDPDIALLRRMQVFFGTWDRALVAAGFDPRQVYLQDRKRLRA